MNTDNANTSQLIIYQSEDGRTRLDVRFVDETVWLTQALMGELFSTTPENVLMHLKNIFSEGELDQNATTKDFLVVRQEGTRQVKRKLKHSSKTQSRP
ncbi:death-on-curing protein [Pseudomonas sp. SWRI102]|uniref:Death-on-curing protein n=1 Tax=Pseudomonas marvdashtae TaxID=2745500 RepID=A0A9E2WSQ7_9PSED|nr:death-on-curing protein [Pseudomonas marvdashtae]MBV4554037.1 death-on-curing protein [Pseudomonas marvdashtae]